MDKAQAALKGVMMELEDCAFPLLAGMVGTADPKVAFKDAEVGAARRRASARSRHGAQGPAARERQDLHRAGQGARRRRVARRPHPGRRQPREHQRLHRDEVGAVAAEEELHRDAAPRPQPRAVAARREERNGGRRHREDGRLGQSLADDVRRLPLRHRRRQVGQGPDRRRELEPHRIPAEGRQARRRDHRGARPVVGGVGGQRGDRPRPRLGARHRRQVGDDGRLPPTAATGSRRT